MSSRATPDPPERHGRHHDEDARKSTIARTIENAICPDESCSSSVPTPGPRPRAPGTRSRALAERDDATQDGLRQDRCRRATSRCRGTRCGAPGRACGRRRPRRRAHASSRPRRPLAAVEVVLRGVPPPSGRRPTRSPACRTGAGNARRARRCRPASACPCRRDDSSSRARREARTSCSGSGTCSARAVDRGEPVLRVDALLHGA